MVELFCTDSNCSSQEVFNAKQQQYFTKAQHLAAKMHGVSPTVACPGGGHQCVVSTMAHTLMRWYNCGESL